MNIDVKMTYLKYILLAGIMCTFASCHREDGPLELPEGKPIGLSTKIENSNLIKSGEDTSLDIFIDKNIVVWGNITTTEGTKKEFGEFGTKVYAGSDEYGNFTGWSYKPQRFWLKEVYQFASVAPASIFNVSWLWDNNTEQVPTTPYGYLTTDNYGSSITLDFGENGYDLSGGQDDIMAAFSDEIDNTDNDAEEMETGVGLNFFHQLSLVSIQAANMEENVDIQITSIKVYGNSSTATEMTIKPATDKDGNKITLRDITTEDNPFKTFEYTSLEGYLPKKTGTENEFSTLVDGLIVFPEECNSFSLEVKYKVNGFETEYTKTGSLPVNWESGKKYTYQFTISLNKMSFGTPTVEPWGDSKEIGNEIEM